MFGACATLARPIYSAIPAFASQILVSGTLPNRPNGLFSGYLPVLRSSASLN